MTCSFRLTFVLFNWTLLWLSMSCSGSNTLKAGDPVSPKISFQGKTFEVGSIRNILKSKSGSLPLQAEFDQCVFKGTFDLAEGGQVYQSLPVGLIFRNCSFEGEVLGNMVQFLGQISFGKCRFYKTFQAQNSVFLAPAGFRECTFDGDAQFQNTVFMKESTWMGSHFYAIPLFQGARFFAKAQFPNTVFHQNADFTLCRFEEGASFDFTRADGNLDLSESRHFGNMTFRKAELLKKLILSKVHSYGQFRFFETRFEDLVVTDGFRVFADAPEISQPGGKVTPSFPSR
jgi:hypothetical protein